MKKILLLFICLSLSLVASAIVSKTIILTNSGTLNSALSASELTSITNLTITGNIDARDFKTMRDEMPALAVVDLSSTAILAHIGTGGTIDSESTTSYYSSNSVPAFSFCNPSTFIGKESIKSIILPQNTITISSSAFYKCTGLTGDLVLPQALKTIGSLAFYGCNNLTGDLKIPSSVTYIGEFAFLDCTGFDGGLLVPSSVEQINSAAFKNCSNLKYIISESNTPIDLTAASSVFWGLNKKTCVLYVNSSSKADYGNAVQWKDFENIMDSPAPLTPAAPFGCTAFSGEGHAIVSFLSPILTGGSSIESYTVTSIPDGITAIGTTSPITINTLTNGTSYTFTVTATNATNTSIPSAPSNSVIPFSTTKSINLTAAGTLFSSLTASDLVAIKNLTITGNIDARDFKTMRDAMPALEYVDLTNTSVIAYTGTAGTNGTSSQSYPINEIPQNAFCNPSTFIGKSSLKTFVFPSLINSIGQNAFKNCLNTNTILIPSTVTNIGVGAFNRFSGLINVASNNITYSSIDGVLFSKDKTTLIQCATSKAGNYTIPSSVVIISAYAFDNCINLTGDLNLPSSLTTIGRYAFNECKGFDGNLLIPTSVTSIDVGAFYKCSGFTGTLNIPSSLNKISDSVFYGCSGFTGTLNIPYSITHISSGAFWGCSGLSGSVTIPSSVTWLGNGVFSFCSKLVGMSIPSSVTHIGSNLLYNCSGLTSLTAFSNTPISFVDPIYGNSTNVFTGVNKSICILYVPANTKTKYSNALQWKDFLNIVEMPSTSIKTELENSITIFPNPVSTSFQINGIVDVAQVTLLDLDGKVLIVQSVSNGESILISNLPNAVYIVSIATKRGTFYRKISKL